MKALIFLMLHITRATQPRVSTSLKCLCPIDELEKGDETGARRKSPGASQYYPPGANERTVWTLVGQHNDHLSPCESLGTFQYSWPSSPEVYILHPGLEQDLM